MIEYKEKHCHYLQDVMCPLQCTLIIMLLGKKGPVFNIVVDEMGICPHDLCDLILEIPTVTVF